MAAPLGVGETATQDHDEYARYAELMELAKSCDVGAIPYADCGHMMG
jgi:hypothetical protein